MESPDGRNFLLKQSIARSPLVTDIYANFKVNLNKKPVNSSSVDHENLLSLKSWNELSQSANAESYDFDNDDFDMDELLEITRPKEAGRDEESDLIYIDLLVKESSISINTLDNNHNLPHNVRSSSHLENEDDDTLIVSLKSGFLLLIKFFQFGDKLKPMVIQDINLRNYYLNKDSSFYLPKIATLGKGVYSKDSIVALTSQSKNIKFCLVDYNSSKITNSINFYVDGIILLNCYIKVNSNHLMFLTLLYTSSRKLQFRLFEKWDDENLDQINQLSPVLLSADFQIPAYLTSVNDTVILIYEESITLLGLSYFMSYDLGNCKSHALFSSEKINNFHVPSGQISQENEILVSTNNGSIYSIGIINLNKIEVNLVFEVPSACSITSFAMYPVENGFKLIYSTDVSASQIIFLDKSFVKLDSEKLNNWSPVIDYSIIKSKYDEEELWLLANQNKKTSLYQIHRGYKLRTEINDSFFKNAERIFKAEIEDTVYFIFNFMNYSSLYKFDDTELELLENEELELNAKTLCFSVAGAPNVLHISEYSMTLYNFHAGISIFNHRLESPIMLADTHGNFVSVIFAEGDNLVVEVLQIRDDTLQSLLKTALGSLQPSLVKFYEMSGVLHLGLGFFNNDMIFFDIKSQKISNAVSLSELHVGFEVPNDLLAIGQTLVISSRNGVYGLFESTFANSKFVKLSDSSVSLVARSETDFFLASKSIYKVSLKESKLPKRCFFDTTYSSSKVSDMVYLTGTNEVISTTSNGLNISTLGSDKDSIIINRRIKLFKSCKKIFDSKVLKMFIVLTGSSFKLEPETEPLIIISQITKKKVNLVDSEFLEENEVIITLSDWRFEYHNDQNELKCHLQLLVSCFNVKTKKACIKVIELRKTDNEEIKLTKLFQWSCSHQDAEAEEIGTDNNKVNLIKQFSNNVIVYCLDNEIFKIDYNFEAKKFEKPTAICSFKTRINSLSIEKNLIVLTILNDSFAVLKFEEKNNDFKLSFKDNLLTNIYNHLILGDRLILIDKYYNILRVFNLNDFTKSSINFKTESLLKLSPCEFSPKWKQNNFPKFISCSLSGEISIFTVLQKSTFEKLENLINSKKARKLYNLNYLGDWFINNENGGRVIEAEKMDELEMESALYDDEIDELFNTIAI